MDRKSLSFFTLGLLVGGLLSAIVFVASLREDQHKDTGDRLVLKLAHVLDPSHPVHKGMAFMAERVAELSHGSVEIQIFPSGQLGSEPESIEQLQRGALAMVKTSAAAMEGFVPEMAVFGLPYLFDDEAHYWDVLNGEIGRELLRAGEANNVHGLCYYDSGSRSFYTVKKPILTPDDVKGLKLRVMPSKMAMDMIKTLGGGPTPIPFGELYTALQQGMIDGAENNPPSFLSARHYEVAKFYSLDEHTRIPDVLIFSKAIWDRLDPQVQRWLEQAAAESVEFQRKLWKEETEKALREVEAAGVQIFHPDKKPFQEATRPMYEALDDERVKALANRIRAVQEGGGHR